MTPARFALAIAATLALMLATKSSGLASEIVSAEAPTETAEAATQNPAPQTTKPAAKPRVELAILLDTSGSMSGLINQARAHLWEIVNEFESARRGGQRPDVYVALYEYGNDGLSQENGWVRQVVPLTMNLDKISEELFALTTNGGSEFCGQVIRAATDQLEWTEGPRVLRSIFIAGNEPFTQGPVDYRQACSAAAAKGITVSTIHCGDHQTGLNTQWADGAKLADGSYLSIDQNQALSQIQAPQDEELARLSSELNSTYIAYGGEKQREQAAARQEAQDSNAAKLAPAASSNRAITKASSNYRNAWCLVEAVCERNVKLEDVPEDQLPEELKKMTLEERQTHLEGLGKRRGELKEQIKTLAAERDRYVAAERAKEAEQLGETLESAVTGAVRRQAEAADFTFE